ncbi:uncharacterized protein LOC126389026 [Scomber scombrus]|uniref:Uncharacterized protein LOC126389026 n=1 Tax=Scomber scombrus TaxID=13677 RepID=A0AAV1Q9V6_SCOSC
MMTAQFFSGASLFALLIVDICCLPVKKGFNPSASNNNAYLSSISSSSGPGFGAGASHTNNNAAPTAGAQRAPAAYLSSISSSSGPGFGAGAALYSGAGDAFQSGAGAALQPYSGDMNWAVAPLSTFSAGDERSAGAYGVGSSGPIYPPPPAYQAGEMSNLEQAFEHGRYETETEDQGFYPSPMQASAKPSPDKPSPANLSQGPAWVVTGANTLTMTTCSLQASILQAHTLTSARATSGGKTTGKMLTTEDTTLHRRPQQSPRDLKTLGLL